jgi:hypothetical protein
MQFSEVPDRTVFDTGMYLFKIATLKKLDTDDGLLTYLGVFECEEPDAFSGMAQMERFTVGDEDDPDAQQGNTWRKSRGAKNFKLMLNAAQVPLIDDEETLFETARGARFVARVVQTVSKKDGQSYGNIRSYYSTTSPEAAKVGWVPTAGAGGVSGVGNGSPTQARGAAPTAAAPTQKMQCIMCGLMVDRADYGKHLVSHRETAPPTTPPPEATGIDPSTGMGAVAGVGAIIAPLTQG